VGSCGEYRVGQRVVRSPQGAEQSRQTDCYCR
jgi:hypothetical protein